MKPIRILYIDDYPLDRALVRDALLKEKSGFELVVADSRAEFERLIADGEYDLVLSDFNILGFTGLQVLEAVQAKSPQIPVIIVTGTGSEEIAAEAIKRGAADYVIKSPQHIRRLPHTIESALQQKKLMEERSLAEYALRESQRTLSTLMGNLPGMAYRSKNTRNWSMFFVSEGCFSLTGYTAEEIIAKGKSPIGNIIYPEDQDDVWNQTQTALQDGCPFQITYRIIRKDGEMRWVWEQGIGVGVDDDDVQILEGFITDITESKLAENAKEHSQRLLLALSKAAPLVQRAQSPKKIYRTIGDEIRKLGFHAAVLELTEDRKCLQLSYLSFQTELLDRIKSSTNLSLVGYCLEIVEDGFFDTILADGEIVFCDPALERVMEAVPKNVRSFIPKLVSTLEIEQAIFAPLHIDKNIFGMLVVIGHSLSEADMPAIDTFANQTAIAIQNVQSRATLEQRGIELQNLTTRLTEIEDAERRRLARELHDQVGQSLALLNFNLNMVIDRAAEIGAHQLDDQIKNAMSMVNEISQGIRDVMDDLRPSVLDDYGLEAALFWFADRYSERTGIKTFVQGDENKPRLPARIENALFRITQEALANIARHAKANLVKILLRDVSNNICLEIEDDGAGFELINPSNPEERRGWGLVNMRERAESVGAEFVLETEPGHGAKIIVRVPKGIS